jgi:DnaJ-domain-containing protein 1
MPAMTGPEHYHRAEQLLAEASQIIRLRQQPGQSGPADLPVRRQDMEERRRLSSDPGLPDRNIAEAQVHATLALAAATAVSALAPDNRAWADIAGTKLSSG